MPEDDIYYWGGWDDGYSGGGDETETEPPETEIDWVDNGDGSWTNPSTGEIVDSDGVTVGYDNGDDSWTDTTGLIFDSNNELVGYENGDGTWTGMDGNVYDSEGTYLHTLPYNVDLTTGEPTVEDEGFFSKVGSFLKNLFGSAAGKGSGGNGGGGSSGGSAQAQQKAQQAQQALQQAKDQGANATQVAALQRQLAAANQALALGNGGAFTVSTNTLVIVGGVALLAAIFLASRNRQN